MRTALVGAALVLLLGRRRCSCNANNETAVVLVRCPANVSRITSDVTIDNGSVNADIAADNEAAPSQERQQQSSCDNLFSCFSLFRAIWEALLGQGETRYQQCGLFYQLFRGGCDTFSVDDAYSEISGLVISPNQVSSALDGLGNPIAFVINDSWNGPLLGAFDIVTGARLMSFRILDAVNVDWESLALGPCGGAGSGAAAAGVDNESCLYIGDFGDNPAGGSKGQENRREGGPYRIYKLKEPLLAERRNGDTIQPDDVLDYDYKNPAVDAVVPDYADSEALFVDPVGWGDDGNSAPGDLYVVTKWKSNQEYNRVFYIPVSAWETNGIYSPVALEPQPGSAFLKETWLDADMNKEGTLLALGTDSGIYVYLRCPGTSIEVMLQQPHCLFFSTPARDYQTETVAFMPDGTQIVQIPEGRNRPIFTSELLYNVDVSQQVCPTSNTTGTI